MSEQHSSDSRSLVKCWLRRNRGRDSLQCDDRELRSSANFGSAMSYPLIGIASINGGLGSDTLSSLILSSSSSHSYHCWPLTAVHLLYSVARILPPNEAEAGCRALSSACWSAGGSELGVINSCSDVTLSTVTSPAQVNDFDRTGASIPPFIA